MANRDLKKSEMLKKNMPKIHKGRYHWEQIRAEKNINNWKTRQGDAHIATQGGVQIHSCLVIMNTPASQ